MKQSYRYLLKNAAILTLSNFFSKILVFLLVPLYTAALSTEEYGLYDAIFSSSHVNCMGPGAPYITQFTEDQPMLHVRLKDLELMVDTGENFAYIDAPIRASIPNMGNPWSEQVQCYYSIILVIQKECHH